MSLSVLSSCLRWRSLLVVWADLPWTPAAALPAQPALTINQWQSEVAGLPLLDWPLPSLPPFPILSLDPSPRLAQAFRQARRPLHMAAGLGDVIVKDEHTLLQLGGDLGERRGLLLAWEDVAGLRAQPDKRHLLAEAARRCRHGGVLVLAPDGGEAFVRVWRQVLAPSLGAAEAETDVFGLGSGFWPEGIEPLAEAPAAVFAVLAQARPSPIVTSNPAIDALKGQRSQRRRRLRSLQKAAIDHPFQVDLQIEIEDEQQAIARLDRELDEMLGVGDQAAGR